MTYPSIKETFYRGDSDQNVILTVPHGADAHEFLSFFPEIKADPQLQKVWPLFETYLAIERDVGATELAHGIALELALGFGIPSRVVEVNYPRGILDGGRLSGHALRACLPPTLMERLQESMLSVHAASLTYMDRLYEQMGSGSKSLLLDVHTMASYCPVDETGHKFTFPVSFPRLEAYVNQYLTANNHLAQRRIDLISADEDGRVIADPRLLSALARELLAEGYACLENEPYHAAPIYLSYRHMQKVPALSIDIPKHLVALCEDERFELDGVDIDAPGVRRLAQTLARGVNAAFL